MTTFATIRLAVYTEAAWTAWDGVLLSGQHAYSSDLLYAATNQMRYKVGNGVDVWTDLDYVPDGSSGSSFPIATAGGTVDAITATFTPALTLTDKMLCAIVASGANTVTNPTFAPDGLTAHTIVKNGGQALVAGDIPAALAVIILEYNLANTRWELVDVQGDTLVTAGALINSATSKGTPVDADYVGLMDSAASNVLKKLSWLNIKATLKTYFDTVYTTTSDVATQITTALSGYLTAATAASTYQVIITAANWGAFIVGLTGKTTPVDADTIDISDSAASGDAKKVSFTNLWTNYFKSKADALYLTRACTLSFSHTSLTVLDATNYFFGASNTTAATATSLTRRGVAPFTGFVKSVGINVIVATVLGTTEQATLKINNKTAGTSVTVSAVLQYDAAGQYYAVTLGTPFAVTAGDQLEAEVDMPTFATNPTGVQHVISICISN